ncbi:chorismate mutase [Fulvivirgaceae bacterium BMA10]|uniref:chorismate mutase n=1 Tax=Splendidivirga corallicola TaxID=3051826 RepID=A0ABT8KSG2_9BACT|nr:chorismate mutase [Fulvivirgaceae bacterium BMA10]
MQPKLKTVPMRDWNLGLDDFVVISGPCSAENEEQVLNTARDVAKSDKVKVLRAGIWKPRTRPNSFEGVGEIGLKWLKKAKEETGLPIAVEVANAQHVELCLKYDVDILWVGARTTVNPFSVQEIADALKGIDIPVMVKNPINPDLQLWIGALERINQAGITKLAAIHRGFSSFEKGPFRNIPKWELPIELMRVCPEIEIICDPSHIAGNRDLIPFISQKAIDMDMHGLMIESHIQPKIALSDAKQQVKPAQLVTLLDELTIRKPSSQNPEFKSLLDELRSEIDEIDEGIIQSLGTRMGISEKIGEYKRDNDVTILQVNRWDEIIRNRLNLAKALGLSETFMNKLLAIIHEESIRRQTDVMNRELAK